MKDGNQNKIKKEVEEQATVQETKKKLKKIRSNARRKINTFRKQSGYEKGILNKKD